MRAIVLVLVLVFFLGCVSSSIAPAPTIPVAQPQVCVGTACVYVEFATTPAERELGLMNRSNLGEASGMLFVFDHSAVYPFWMKDTLISLDGIWISEGGKIVDIQTMTPCENEPCDVYTPQGDSLYVLEVNGGWAQKNNVHVGDTATLPTI